MKVSLVIMAAGLGSRFGRGKPIGPNNEIIIDYSIHDAIFAGFNKIIFIIRKDIEKDFIDIIGNRIKKICDRLGVEVCYAFQDLKDLIKEPFAVINADDYYGKEAFKNMYSFLKNYNSEKLYDFCMSGFIL